MTGTQRTARPDDDLEKGYSNGSSKTSASSREDVTQFDQNGSREIKNEAHQESSPVVERAQSSASRRATRSIVTRLAAKLSTRSIPDPPPPPPDGGVKAWTQVGMGFLIVFITWGWVNSYGVFQSYYTANLPESPSTISWIGSIQNYLTFFIGAFSGRLLDAGLFLPTIIVGGVIQILGIFMMSLSKTYWQLMLTQGVMTGIGGGIFFTPCMGIVGTYFSSRRALAIGLVSAGNSAGGMIYPVIVQQLLPKIGFGWTTRVIGFLNLTFLAIGLCFFEPRLPPRKSGPLVDFTAFKEPTYALFVAGLFFMIWPIYYTFYYLSSYGVDVVDMPLSTALTLTIIINGVGLPTRILPTFFADRYGQFNTMVPVLASLATVAWCWIAVDTPGGLYTFAVFYGMVSAGVLCLLASTVASITVDMSTFGARLGMAFSTLSFAALTGPSLGGALQGAMGGRYLGAQIWAALSTTICLVLVFLSRRTKAGWIFSGIKC